MFYLVEKVLNLADAPNATFIYQALTKGNGFHFDTVEKYNEFVRNNDTNLYDFRVIHDLDVNILHSITNDKLTELELFGVSKFLSRFDTSRMPLTEDDFLILEDTFDKKAVPNLLPISNYEKFEQYSEISTKIDDICEFFDDNSKNNPISNFTHLLTEIMEVCKKAMEDKQQDFQLKLLRKK